jgi:PAS domain S-box-containing protein
MHAASVEIQSLPASLSDQARDPERAVDALDAELRDFVTEGPEALHQFDASGTILWANQAELDLLGYRHDEFVGRGIQEFHEDRALVSKFLARLAQGETVRNLRSRMLCRDGAWKDVLIDSNVARDRDGAFLRSRCFVRDITPLVRAEIERDAATARLRQRERQQRSLAHLSREALRNTDFDHLLATIAREVAETLDADLVGLLETLDEGRLRYRAGVGWGSSVSTGGDIVAAPRGSQDRHVLEADGPIVVPDLEREARFVPSVVLLRHGVRSSLSVPVRGRARPFGILGIHLRSQRAFSPEDTQFVAAVADILAGAIERRAAEQELERNRDQLEHLVAHRTEQLATSNRELEAFSYSVSHDLREPLRAINGYSSLLLRRLAQMPAESLQLLEGVRTNSLRLGKLIDDLLDLSRVQRADLVRTTVDLSRLAAGILEAHAAAEPGRAVAWDIEPGITVSGDQVLIETMLRNLLDNAWKFTRRTADARIELRRLGPAQHALLCVRDNGAGFDMALAAKLFRPFERLHLATEFEGTGVGLATVKRIVQRHGGYIWAEGRPGSGASFYFTLGPVVLPDVKAALLAGALAAPVS